MSAKPRQQLYAEARADGLTYKQIAKTFDVSQSAVRDGVKRHNDSEYRPAARHVRAERRPAGKKSRFKEAFELVRDGVAVTEVAKRLGLNRNTVRRAYRYYTDPEYRHKRCVYVSNRLRGPAGLTRAEAREQRRLSTERALGLFLSGVKVSEIASKTGLTYQTVYRRIQKASGLSRLAQNKARGLHVNPQ